MKRLQAKRDLKRTCDCCNQSILKNDIYYIDRKVYKDDNGIYAFEILTCPKCNYKNEQHKKRFEKFKSNCKHPIKKEIWSYIPGECVKQPDHDECMICGKYL